jgi:hypothetical protein
MSVDVIEYRNGNDKENSPRKLNGLTTVSDVTLKRGIIGSLGLYNWINQIRNGDHAAVRTVTIQLQNEDHCHRHDLEAPSRANRQAHQRTAEREGDGRRDRRTDARVRAARAGVAPSVD